MAYFQDPDRTYGWMRCVYCNIWDKTDFFITRRGEMHENTYTPRYGPNFLCMRCFRNGPPHNKYLIGLLKNTTLSTNLINKVAYYAYQPCAIQECKYDVFDSEYEYECDFCDDLWAGWKCLYCGDQKSKMSIYRIQD